MNGINLQGGFALTQGSGVRGRTASVGAALGLLLLSIILSACGGTPAALNWPGLTLAGDTIYVISGSPQKVYMLDAETGAQKGTFMPQGEFKGTVWWSPVTVGDGLAFVGFADSNAKAAALYVFDPETGQELWHVPAESVILPAPVYADGVVYFGSSDGRLYAVDVETKRVKPGWPFQAEDAIWGSPLVVDGRVYLAAMDHYLYSLDAETGKEIWKTEFTGAMAAQPVLVPPDTAVGGMLYVGTFDGKAHAIRADSGEIVEGFEFQAENWVWSEVLVANDLLYVTSLDGYLYALDPSSGAVVPPYPYNSAEIDDQDETLRASPLQSGEFIIVAAQSGWLIAVKDAQRQWYWPSGAPQAELLTTPIVAGDKIYIVLMDGKVQVLDAETGVPGWSFSPPESK